MTFRDERELDTNKMFKENCLKLILGLKTVLSATHLRRGALYCFLAMLFWYALCTPVAAQDWIKTGTGLGVERIRIAVPEFKA